jgi:hypothetical protein
MRKQKVTFRRERTKLNKCDRLPIVRRIDTIQAGVESLRYGG